MGIERLYEVPSIGELTPVGQGVLWLRLPLPFQLDHINVWLVEEDHQYTLIDCGANLPEVAAIWEELENTLFSTKPLGRIIVTHAHPDHIGMAGPLARKHECPVVMSAGEYFFTRAMCAGVPGFDAKTLADFNAAHGLVADKATEMNKARGGLFARLVPEPPLSYLRMQDGDVLEIGGQQWECHAGYGHSVEHISLVCRELNLMISGDMLLPTISTNVSVYGSEPEGNPLLAFLKSVQRMQNLPDSLTVLPSHGVPFKGVKHRCESLLRHHEHRLNELLEALAEQGAMSAQQAVSVLFRRQMDGHQMSFAMGEAIAHLHYLWRLGQVERMSDQGIWKFKRA
ncbi:MAG: MBL fold metallo-hydrolase [Limnobacter sp.]|nr:MBL fold metallo-hydrolase [Limnobacter sp.]